MIGTQSDWGRCRNRELIISPARIAFRGVSLLVILCTYQIAGSTFGGLIVALSHNSHSLLTAQGVYSAAQHSLKEVLQSFNVQPVDKVCYYINDIQRLAPRYGAFFVLTLFVFDIQIDTQSIAQPVKPL